MHAGPPELSPCNAPAPGSDGHTTQGCQAVALQYGSVRLRWTYSMGSK
jgi:hypothetical protein